MVGDQRLLGDVFQRQVLFLAQWVGNRQHQHVLPFVAGQGDQLGVGGQGLGGDANLGHLVDQHARHLLGRALVQADVDLGVGLAQARHRLGQHIAGLGVGGGDRQGAAVFRAVLLADAFEVADLAQDQLDAFEHMLAGLGDALKPLAVPGKNLHPQLFFQLDDRLGHTGLRGVQRFGGFGQVQVAANSFLNKTELMQVHIKNHLRVRFIMPQTSIHPKKVQSLPSIRSSPGLRQWLAAASGGCAGAALARPASAAAGLPGRVCQRPKTSVPRQ